MKAILYRNDGVIKGDGWVLDDPMDKQSS